MRPRSASATPSPLSLTRMSYVLSRRCTSTRTQPPGAVNFNAFSTRLSSMRLISSSSATIRRSLSEAALSSTSRAAATLRMERTDSAISSSR